MQARYVIILTVISMLDFELILMIMLVLPLKILIQVQYNAGLTFMSLGIISFGFCMK